jgi:mannosyltransferase OCH1-like enzyme
MMIPKIIHQTWKTQDIPQKFSGFVKTWKKYHPDWEYKLWSDKDNRAFIKTHYPSFLNLYDGYTSNIKKADAIRYFILHQYGGIYADCDFECLKPFDPLIAENKGCFLGYEPELHSTRLYKKNNLACNAIMASVPGHRLWEHIFSILEENKSIEDVMDATGPRMLQSGLESYPYSDVTVFQSKVFYPLVDITNLNLALSEDESSYYSNMLKKKIFPDESYAVHHWAGTWYSGGIPGAAKRLLTRLINSAQVFLRRFFI